MPISLPGSVTPPSPTPTIPSTNTQLFVGPPATVEIGSSFLLPMTVTVNGVATDPSSITLSVRDPAGATTTLVYAPGQIIRSNVGQYYYLWPCTLMGRHLAVASVSGAQATTQFQVIRTTN